MRKDKNERCPPPGVPVGDTGYGLRAGVGKRDITTDEPGAIIADPLYAKALVLDDGITKTVIITMDVTAIGGREISDGRLPDVGENFLPSLRARIEKEFGVPGHHVLVNASHTHPPGHMLCSDAEQIKRTFDAVHQAVETMTMVEVGAGSGYEDRITMNRTLDLDCGKQWSIRHTNPCPQDNEVAGIRKIDPEIGILRIDRIDGRPLAVLYNFACHPLFGDAKGSITANFPGVASRIIEDALGEHTMALFLQGAAGDIIDVGFKNFNQVRDVETIGTKLGLSTLHALQGIVPQPAKLSVLSETLELPRRSDIPDQIALLKEEQAELLESLEGTTLSFKSFLPLYIQYSLSPECPLDYAFRYMQGEEMKDDSISAMDDFNRKNIDNYLNGIRVMERLARIQDKITTLEKHQKLNVASGQSTVQAEVQGIRIGDAVIIGAPIELLVEVGMNIKKLSPFKHTLIAGFSNGYLHYGPPGEMYDRGGYEVTECLLAPQWQQLFEDKASEIIGHLHEEISAPLAQK